MQPDAFVTHLGRLRASAILRTADPDAAGPAMEAAVRGGFRVVEFTLTTPGAYELIADFSRRDDLVVGAGTVLTEEEAARAVEAGARFLVSPVVDEAVIGAAVRLGVAAMPGTHTPTEMVRAWKAGALLQKVFPIMAGGAAAIRACLGPLPFLNLVPTNGVDENNAAEVLAAGAHAVGFVAPLFVAGAMADHDWKPIEERARLLLAACAG